MSRIGIMGGSFDPPHRAHLKMAHLAVSEAKLDQVYFIPSYQSLLKGHKPIATNEQRLAMLNLLVNEVPKAQISTYEMDRQEPVATYDTVKYIRAKDHADKIFIIIGADQAAQFDKWQNWQQLLGLANVIWFSREGYSASEVLRGHGLEIEMSESISSTHIREQMGLGFDVSAFVRSDIHAYITGEGLYL